MQRANGWNPAVPYPVPDPDHSTLFRDDKFYAYMFWEDLNAPDFQWSTKEDACAAQHPTRHDFYPAAAAQLGLEAPTFQPEEAEASGKIIDSTLLRQVTGYKFHHDDLLAALAHC